MNLHVFCEGDAEDDEGEKYDDRRPLMRRSDETRGEGRGRVAMEEWWRSGAIEV